MEGPQVNVAMGNQAQAGNGVGWQGMTIKDILEKVDLFNLTSFPDNNGDDDKKLKDIKSNLTMHDAHLDEKTRTILPATNSAFLGPKIWKKPLNFYKVNGGDNGVNGIGASVSNQQGPEFSSMSIDEFLSGCLRLKGTAKAVDMVTLLFETGKMNRKLSRMERMLLGDAAVREDDGPDAEKGDGTFTLE